MSSNEEPFKEESTPTKYTLDSREIEVETKTSKLNVFNWSMYDLANTIYSILLPKKRQD